MTSILFIRISRPHAHTSDKLMALLQNFSFWYCIARKFKFFHNWTTDKITAHSRKLDNTFCATNIFQWLCSGMRKKWKNAFENKFPTDRSAPDGGNCNFWSQRWRLCVLCVVSLLVHKEIVQKNFCWDKNNRFVGLSGVFNRETDTCRTNWCAMVGSNAARRYSAHDKTRCSHNGWHLIRVLETITLLTPKILPVLLFAIAFTSDSYDVSNGPLSLSCFYSNIHDFCWVRLVTKIMKVFLFCNR